MQRRRGSRRISNLEEKREIREPREGQSLEGKRSGKLEASTRRPLGHSVFLEGKTSLIDSGVGVDILLPSPRKKKESKAKGNLGMLASTRRLSSGRPLIGGGRRGGGIGSGGRSAIGRSDANEKLTEKRSL